MFTEQPATRCDEVLAVDLSPQAVDIARQRLLPLSDRVTVEVVAVHWRWPVPEYPNTGDQVHERLQDSDFVCTARYVDDDFRLDVFARTKRPTLAQQEGLVWPSAAATGRSTSTLVPVIVDQRPIRVVRST